MKRIILLVPVALLLASCSSWQGTMGKDTDSFTDEHGRVCTAMKWGESASIDCDFPEGSR